MDAIAIPDWLLRASWQAGLLTLIVLAVRAAMGPRFPVRWGYAMWVVIALRLIIPAFPQSEFSVFNLAASTPAPEMRATAEPAVMITFGAVGETQERAAAPTPSVEPATPTVSMRSVLGIAWLAGTLLLLSVVLWRTHRFSRRIAAAPRIEDLALLHLIGRCRAELRIRQPIVAVETAAVASPTLAGFWRPVLCLPLGAAARLSADELRFVVLHELAHVKRWDIAANWVFTLVQIVHWFNPLVWIAFACCRADREMLCDGAALAQLREEERAGYGITLLKMLKDCRPGSPAPCASALIGSRWEFKRRIAMIHNYSPATRRRTLAVAAAIVLSAGLALTDAGEPQSSETSPPTTTASDTMAIYDVSDFVPANSAAAMLQLEEKLRSALAAESIAATLEGKGKHLVVTAANDAHALISGKLAEMRAESAQQVLIEARFIEITPDEATDFIKAMEADSTLFVAETNGTAWVGTTPSARTLEMGMKEGAKGLSTLSAPKILTLNKQQASVTVHQERSYIADYKITDEEYDPIVRKFLVGLTLDVTPVVSQDGKSVTLTTHFVSTREATAPQIIFITPGGDINDPLGNINLPVELPNIDRREINATFSIKDGGTVLLRTQVGKETGFIANTAGGGNVSGFREAQVKPFGVILSVQTIQPKPASEPENGDEKF